MSSRSKTSSRRNGSNGSGSTDDPKAQWSTQSYSLEDLTKQFTFPQVVRSHSTFVTRKDNPFPVNLTQPMLLYETRTVKKILARNVLFDPKIKRYNETDETLVIPSDYEGHFVRLQSRTAKDSTVHRTVESLVSGKVPAFLNLTNVTTFRLTPPNKVVGEYQRVDYTPGNIFIPDKIVHGATKVKPDPFSKRNSRYTNGAALQDVNYLKCRDERKENIIIPLNHPGEFVEILPNPFEDGKLSVTAENIMTSQKYPMVVKYVYGGNKPRLTKFSGLFTLLDSFEESGVVACVLDTSGFTLIEIPLSTPMSFKLALNSHDLFHIPFMKGAIKLCEKKSQVFKKDLMYKYKFSQTIEKVGETSILDRSVSTNDGGVVPPLSARDSARLGITQSYFYL